jgi:hypothetical protein
MASKSTSLKKKKAISTKERKNIAPSVALKVLIEAGFRCAVPTCRNTLAMDLHHLWQFSMGGGDAQLNLIALCPYCHGLHHRGTIPAEALYVYKSLLVSLGQAFDVAGIDNLLFLRLPNKEPLIVSGDGVLTFSRLIASGLASFELEANNNGQLVTYSISLTEKGNHLIRAWISGNRDALQEVLNKNWAHLDGTNRETKNTKKRIAQK